MKNATITKIIIFIIFLFVNYEYSTAIPTVEPSFIPTEQPTLMPTLSPSDVPTYLPSEVPSSIPTNRPSSQPSLQPSSRPTTMPTTQPTGHPTNLPTSMPTGQPTTTPSSMPSSMPTSNPTSVPTSSPTSSPTSTPTSVPTSPPTSIPTMMPTSIPTSIPTDIPSGAPTTQPTSMPSSQPTNAPTSTPTVRPTSQPSSGPTGIPTSTPTSMPTGVPTNTPTGQPTSRPSNQPTSIPTTQPTSSPTSMPTSIPTSIPSSIPTSSPTSIPTSSPTGIPTNNPTSQPTSVPTNVPTSIPTSKPTSLPTGTPTGLPTSGPTSTPTSIPSSLPTETPTGRPTSTPTGIPTSSPTSVPTSSPTSAPTSVPTDVPTSSPTSIPTSVPTSAPTSSPTGIPTSSPSGQPTSAPTTIPTSTPTNIPSSVPTSIPTGIPSTIPTSVPTGQPTSVPTTIPTSVPTTRPTSIPSSVPTGTPTSVPTSIPTSSPTSVPTSTPTSIPSGQPTGIPTSTPSSRPTSSPTGVPTSSPTSMPTSAPTATPTSAPTNVPTHLPTSVPTSSPTSMPTSAPTSQPTNIPTSAPSSVPTSVPTSSPTSVPSSVPTSQPTNLPTSAPTSVPTSVPTSSPTSVPSSAPTSIPTSVPTSAPTSIPTSAPTSQPTSIPTSAPTSVPTSVPTSSPTSVPSSAPTSIPTSVPTSSPTSIPTSAPTGQPTSVPTSSPTSIPTSAPTSQPTSIPTSAPTSVPTSVPTSNPTSIPTSTPTSVPTSIPTSSPTSIPTSAPTSLPTSVPTSAPTSVPTSVPTSSPTSLPTSTPTSVPTSIPTSSPTSIPTSAPTGQPTSIPTSAPTSVPTSVPTSSPTSVPSSAPTSVPTSVPTSSPTSVPTSIPTSRPSSSPTSQPTRLPTPSPTRIANPYGYLIMSTYNSADTQCRGQYFFEAIGVGVCAYNSTSKKYFSMYSVSVNKISVTVIITEYNDTLCAGDSVGRSKTYSKGSCIISSTSLMSKLATYTGAATIQSYYQNVYLPKVTNQRLSPYTSFYQQAVSNTPITTTLFATNLPSVVGGVYINYYITDTCTPGTEYTIDYLPNSFCKYDKSSNDYYQNSCTNDIITYNRFSDSQCANRTNTYTVPVTSTCTNATVGYQSISCSLPIPINKNNHITNFFTTTTAIPVLLSAVIGLIGILFLIKRSFKYRKLRKLPIHRTLNAIKISEGLVLDMISRYPETANLEDSEGHIAMELAIKRDMNTLVLYELCKLSLPYHHETLTNIPPEIHRYAWIKFIQKDTNISAVELILDSYPMMTRLLSEAKDAAGRTALNLASPKCDLAIREALYFMKRYEIVNFDDPEHVSATCRLHIARDRKNNDEKVALKFMNDYTQYLREINIRANMNLSSDYVINLIGHYDIYDKEHGQLYAKEIKVKDLLNYSYCIIMPAGSKTLHTIIASEHIAGKEWYKVKEIAIELAQALDHLHENGVIHGDVKPLNIMRVGNSIKLIDLDAASSIQIEYAGAKYSSAYIPPEMIYVKESDKNKYHTTRFNNTNASSSSNNNIDYMNKNNSDIRVKSYRIDPITKTIITTNLPYNLIPADISYDAWSYGVVLFELFTGKKLLFANFEDNIDNNDLYDVYTFTNTFKSRKLATIQDVLARNLVSQLLTKDPIKRPNMKQILAHPFLSGRSAPRMLGEVAEFDVFISYRVKTDSDLAKLLYDSLTTAGFKVWWDKMCLEPGTSWEEGFCNGLIKSRIFLPIISKGAINNDNDLSCNFQYLTPDSKPDNVLLEYWLALELQHRGFIDKIYPIMIGNRVHETDGNTGITSIHYTNFFKDGGQPLLSPRGPVVVLSIEKLIEYHLDRLCLGTLLLQSLTVAQILASILKNQGRLIEGSADSAFDLIPDDVTKMKQRIHMNDIDSYSLYGSSPTRKGSQSVYSSKASRYLTTNRSVYSTRNNSSHADDSDYSPDSRHPSECTSKNGISDTSAFPSDASDDSEEEEDDDVAENNDKVKGVIQSQILAMNKISNGNSNNNKNNNSNDNIVIQKNAPFVIDTTTTTTTTTTIAANSSKKLQQFLSQKKVHTQSNKIQQPITTNSQKTDKSEYKSRVVRFMDSQLQLQQLPQQQDNLSQKSSKVHVGMNHTFVKAKGSSDSDDDGDEYKINSTLLTVKNLAKKRKSDTQKEFKPKSMVHFSNMDEILRLSQGTVSTTTYDINNTRSNAPSTCTYNSNGNLSNKSNRSLSHKSMKSISERSLSVKSDRSSISQHSDGSHNSNISNVMRRKKVVDIHYSSHDRVDRMMNQDMATRVNLVSTTTATTVSPNSGKALQTNYNTNNIQLSQVTYPSYPSAVNGPLQDTCTHILTMNNSSKSSNIISRSLSGMNLNTSSNSSNKANNLKTNSIKMLPHNSTKGHTVSATNLTSSQRNSLQGGGGGSESLKYSDIYDDNNPHVDINMMLAFHRNNSDKLKSSSKEKEESFLHASRQSNISKKISHQTSSQRKLQSNSSKDNSLRMKDTNRENEEDGDLDENESEPYLNTSMSISITKSRTSPTRRILETIFGKKTIAYLDRHTNDYKLHYDHSSNTTTAHHNEEKEELNSDIDSDGSSEDTKSITNYKIHTQMKNMKTDANTTKDIKRNSRKFPMKSLKSLYTSDEISLSSKAVGSNPYMTHKNKREGKKVTHTHQYTTHKRAMKKQLEDHEGHADDESDESNNSNRHHTNNSIIKSLRMLYHPIEDGDDTNTMKIQESPMFIAHQKIRQQLADMGLQVTNNTYTTALNDAISEIPPSSQDVYRSSSSSRKRSGKSKKELYDKKLSTLTRMLVKAATQTNTTTLPTQSTRLPPTNAVSTTVTAGSSTTITQPVTQLIDSRSQHLNDDTSMTALTERYSLNSSKVLPMSNTSNTSTTVPSSSLSYSDKNWELYLDKITNIPDDKYTGEEIERRIIMIREKLTVLESKLKSQSKSKLRSDYDKTKKMMVHVKVLNANNANKISDKDDKDSHDIIKKTATSGDNENIQNTDVLTSTNPTKQIHSISHDTSQTQDNSKSNLSKQSHVLHHMTDTVNEDIRPSMMSSFTKLSENITTMLHIHSTPEKVTSRDNHGSESKEHNTSPMPRRNSLSLYAHNESFHRPVNLSPSRIPRRYSNSSLTHLQSDVSTGANTAAASESRNVPNVSRASEGSIDKESRTSLSLYAHNESYHRHINLSPSRIPRRHSTSPMTHLGQSPVAFSRLTTTSSYTTLQAVDTASISRPTLPPLPPLNISNITTNTIKDTLGNMNTMNTYIHGASTDSTRCHLSHTTYQLNRRHPPSLHSNSNSNDIPLSSEHPQLYYSNKELNSEIDVRVDDSPHRSIISDFDSVIIAINNDDNDDDDEERKENLHIAYKRKENENDSNYNISYMITSDKEV